MASRGQQLATVHAALVDEKVSVPDGSARVEQARSVGWPTGWAACSVGRSASPSTAAALHERGVYQGRTPVLLPDTGDRRSPPLPVLAGRLTEEN